MVDIESQQQAPRLAYGSEGDLHMCDSAIDTPLKRAFKVALESTWIYTGCSLCLWAATLTAQAILKKHSSQTPVETPLIFGSVMVAIVWFVFFPASVLCLHLMRTCLIPYNAAENQAYWEPPNMYRRFKYGVWWGFTFYAFLTILLCLFSPFGDE